MAEKIKKELIEKILVYWIPLFIWALLIFGFSANPTTSVSEIHWQDFIVKKLAHIIEYGIFTLLLYRTLKASGLEKKEAGYYSVIFAVIYAFSDEFHQSFTPGRQPALRDVVFDTIGSVSAIYLIWNIIPKAPKKLRRLAKNLQLI